MEELFILELDPDFPLFEIEQIAAFLMEKKCLVPGYSPPKAGLLDVSGMYYSRDVEKQETIVLPDRNLVGRMAKIARDGIKLADAPTKIAANLMAYCQCLNIQIEPSIAMYELAAHDGNQGALDELEWFRIADKSNPKAWVNMAMGKSKEPIDWCETKTENPNLDRPLHRWRRNYVVALKIAELKLSKLSPKECMFCLLEWMVKDFIIAGPATNLALFYLSQNPPSRRTFKNLRASDRNKAVLGIKNEAWDMTYLSEFLRQIKDHGNDRFIFASADKRLVALARNLFVPNELGDKLPHLRELARKWWPSDTADEIAQKIFDCSEIAAARPMRQFDDKLIDNWIADGEAKVRAYRPT